ncbi:arginase family protein [Microbacterium sp. 3J1]|uniref:arginase family protein n=1 Tax=Microbacterium sp. 3J1 TaxID=861269 RepID=UPI000ABE0583|nr:arginase family protein [Microbacterium sp. 3J1]
MIAIVSAPSNLGLRPPVPGAVPGTSKAPEALREAGLHAALSARGAIDGGAILPGRYVDDPGRGERALRNQGAIIDHARRLASRLVALRGGGHAPLVLGGDCSLIVAAGLASRTTGGAGLVHIDGHTDFRHPGNSAAFGSLAGEDLAAAIGEHVSEIADIDGLGPYFDAAATAHIGCRKDDAELAEVLARIAVTVPADQVISHGASAVAERVLAAPGLSRGFWLQVDVDVLDPEHMPAVDSPDPGGLAPGELVGLLRELAPRAWGAAITVFDPDLDPTGAYARLLAGVIDEGLARLGEDAAPD